MTTPARRWLWLFFGLAVLSLPAQTLPAQSQALLNLARAATPQRYQFAVDQGVSILPTSDSRSFYLLWRPPGLPAAPLIVSLHGSSSWAFDEFFLWKAQAEKSGYGIIALQWWFGAAEGPNDYYLPDALHRELRAAVKAAGGREGGAVLHGFSRGSANIYGVAALDRQSGDRYYAVVIANAGGASADFPPNLAITGGTYGYNVFSGTYWILFCGGRDPNPDRDGCPAMQRTADWIGQYGGVIDLFIQDAAAGHGSFQQTPAHLEGALAICRKNFELRQGAIGPATVWQIRRDGQFQIAGASIPNLGMVGSEVWLVVGMNNGTRLYRSADGSNSTASEVIPGLSTALADSGFGAGEVVPRQDRDGTPLLYVLGLAPPGVNRSALLRLASTAGRFVRNPVGPVFEGGPEDAQFIGVPDLTPSADGRLRLIYVARGSPRSNSRTAVSNDNGASFAAEFNNPFGDLAVPTANASNINVDPAVLKLAAGGYLAVAMRLARLYLFVSIDGRTFVPSVQPAIEPADLAPGTTGLFDPTLVQFARRAYLRLRHGRRRPGQQFPRGPRAIDSFPDSGGRGRRQRSQWSRTGCSRFHRVGVWRKTWRPPSFRRRSTRSPRT